MSQIYDLRFTLDSSGSQPQIIELLKSNGFDCIQTSSGLCAKSDQSLAKVKELLSSKNLLSGVTVRELDTSSELPDDVKAFIGG